MHLHSLHYSTVKKLARTDDCLALVDGSALSYPCYVYDLEAIRQQVAIFRNAFHYPRLTLLFATMANDCESVLATIASLGVGACVNSLPHLRLAQQCGFVNSLIQYTSTSISPDTLTSLVEQQVAVNLDSQSQVLKWCQRAPKSKFGIRVNASSLSSSSQSDRIGISAQDIKSVSAIAKESKSSLVGLHVYVGTNFQSSDDMLPAIKSLMKHASELESLEYINIGGGVGIDYAKTNSRFDIEQYGDVISLQMRKLSNFLGREIELYFEPGRSMVASAGKFYVQIIDIKELNDSLYVGVNASISTFPRPFQHPSNQHHVTRMRQVNQHECLQAYVVGQTTFSKDILAYCSLPSDIEIGDILIFHDAGAYCQSMFSNFLGQQMPMTYVLCE